MKNIHNSHECHTSHIKALVRRNPKQWFVLIQSVRFTPNPDFTVEYIFGEGDSIDRLTKSSLQQLPYDYIRTQTVESITNEIVKQDGAAITVGKALVLALSQGNIPKDIINQVNKHLMMVMRYRSTTIGSLMGLHDPLENVLEKSLNNLRKKQIVTSNNDNRHLHRHSHKGESRNPVNPRIKFPEEKPEIEITRW